MTSIVKADDLQFGRYRLIGVMASGGMSRLYLAAMVGVDGFSRVVALKRVLPYLAHSEEFIRMFVNEARFAARLDHPNVVRIYELGELDGQHFICMEYLPAEDLAQIVRQCKRRSRFIPIGAATAIGQSVAEALQYAHDLGDEDNKRLGIVHRDVSLSNVLVTYHGVAKLADFGIAKATEAASAHTRAGVFKGKFAYASPEQVRGDAVDARTDIFALGIVLWEILAVKRLFKRSNDAATISAVEKTKVPSLSNFRSDVPRELDLVIRKCLSQKPADRFQTAGELSEALENLGKASRSTFSARDLRRWVTDLFGPERSKLKMSIAQGIGLDSLQSDGTGQLPAEHAALLGLKPIGHDDRSAGNLSSAQTPAGIDFGAVSEGPVPSLMDEGSSTSMPRPQWSTNTRDTRDIETQSTVIVGSQAFAENTSWSGTSTDRSSVSERPTPPPRQASNPGRRNLLIGAFAGTLGLVSVVVALSTRDATRERRRRTVTLGQVALSSTPSGASIEIDGVATGLLTPAVVESLPIDRTISVRLELTGHEPAELSLSLTDGERTERAVRLVELGTLVIEGITAGMSVSVGARAVPSSGAVEVSVGEHSVVAKKDGRTILSGTIEVRAGEQSIDLANLGNRLD